MFLRAFVYFCKIITHKGHHKASWIDFFCTWWIETYEKSNQTNSTIHFSMLPIHLDNLKFFKNKLSFFVLLQFLIGFYIFPAQHFLTITAVYICNCVQACDEISVLCKPYRHIHCMGEQKRSAPACLSKQSK